MAGTKVPEHHPASGSEIVPVSALDVVLMQEHHPVEDITRDEYVKMAKEAGKEMRYKDVVYTMKKVVVGLTPPDELTDEERELLKVAYTFVFLNLQLNWLDASFPAEKLEDKLEDTTELLKVRDNILAIEADVREICDNEILKLLREILEPTASTSESKIFYLNMIGDLCMMLVCVKSGDDKKIVTDEAFGAYSRAQEIANADEAVSEEARLQLALSFSKFHDGILHEPLKAMTMAAKAHGQATSKLKDMKGEMLKECTALCGQLESFLSRVQTEEMERQELDDPSQLPQFPPVPPVPELPPSIPEKTRTPRFSVPSNSKFERLKIKIKAPKILHTESSGNLHQKSVAEQQKSIKRAKYTTGPPKGVKGHKKNNPPKGVKGDENNNPPKGVKGDENNFYDGYIASLDKFNSATQIFSDTQTHANNVMRDIILKQLENNGKYLEMHKKKEEDEDDMDPMVS